MIREVKEIAAKTIQRDGESTWTFSGTFGNGRVPVDCLNCASSLPLRTAIRKGHKGGRGGLSNTKLLGHKGCKGQRLGWAGLGWAGPGSAIFHLAGRCLHTPPSLQRLVSSRFRVCWGSGVSLHPGCGAPTCRAAPPVALTLPGLTVQEGSSSRLRPHALPAGHNGVHGGASAGQRLCCHKAERGTGWGGARGERGSRGGSAGRGTLFEEEATRVTISRGWGRQRQRQYELSGSWAVCVCGGGGGVAGGWVVG